MRADFTVHASVHDVMPETLDLVEAFAPRLEAAGLAPALLLVVSGRHWTPQHLARLRALCARGHALAGHGWRHGFDAWGGLCHRVHGAVLSRRAAEHLALQPAAVPGLIRGCRQWFDANHLPAPECYVPPAWAMGAVPMLRLHGLGFRYFECLTGVYDTHSGRWRRTPLVGFEADTPLRRLLLRASNRANLALARMTGRLRLAIHPEDEQLLLAGDLRRWLAPGPVLRTPQ